MDLNDVVRKKPVLGKLAYTARVRAILRSPAAQEVAKNIGKGYLNTCKEVVRLKGAASSGSAVLAVPSTWAARRVQDRVCVVYI